jgi:hypothetical protein
MTAPPHHVDIRRIDMPPDAPRVETGPVQFGDDWPGTFIRGDSAACYATVLRNILHAPPPQWSIETLVLRRLLAHLEASRVLP